MTLQIVRLTTTEADRPEVEAALTAAVAALAEADPPGVRYAALRLGDEPSYLLVLHLDEGVANPLPALPAARALREAMPAWAGGPVAPVDATVVAAHGSPAGLP
ncbi:MAG TPA: hypothetical protein VFU19_17350 [Iamia sp.]|nr:hypothetical protein [Iamia sp.]